MARPGALSGELPGQLPSWCGTVTPARRKPFLGQTTEKSGRSSHCGTGEPLLTKAGGRAASGWTESVEAEGWLVCFRTGET